MVPIATARTATVAELKAQVNTEVVDPFYSPSAGTTDEDGYEYADYKPHYPVLSWEPLVEQEVTDRGLSADPEKKALFSAAQKVKNLTPVIGTEVIGIDLRQLNPSQKDELALLVAEKGVVFFRDQELNVHEQLELGRYFGPLHKYPTSGVPKDPGLEEVHGVYSDAANRRNPAAFAEFDLSHSDLRPLLIAEPGFQKYLEDLTALHSAVSQADRARAKGLPVRREPVENVHPIVRVHPVTGWNSVYVNKGFTRRIIGVPKAESDAILQFLWRQLSENPDFQVRFHWEPNSVAVWDNRVVTHSATFDFWPQTRHALRVTPHGEKPECAADYELRTGKAAKDYQTELWKKQGIEPPQPDTANVRVRGYNY
ncbi:hypothetical protein F5141DRAFT_1292508 [Pisolithus sp. B1]|nr:hypothetical protein F5141DRAFT_1292508 [Pisolithus sp. B1]